MALGSGEGALHCEPRLRVRRAGAAGAQAADLAEHVCTVGNASQLV